MAKLSTFILVMIGFSLIFTAGIATWMGSINDRYTVENYNESKLSTYNKLAEISTQTNEIKNKTLSLQSKSGIIDVLGGFFESGYDALKLTANSFDTFFSFSNQFFNDINIHNAGLFRIAFISAAIIIIFVGIIISTVVKRES